ncbi:hypothetical protein GA707_09515 [Nostocoides sp. F2B08]|uniref:type IV toxin-antitoxin system AbiEi family antitoxin domain-containing protein n=1 Tax=Nostocoides sp. F2B08 TaxID=2653936 RepID=UPI001262EAB0|nr:type IV toxin-antitoxin system AbiEi family antitoxin domain-containing protein [Tetrasphaera sp. F2B08]KAB7744801.1 hypothetical protein GA707_09515 [Tetrasphaera sp. F2B08]
MSLDAILRRQHGVVSHDQALASGLTSDAVRWRVTSGRWERITRGLYRIRHAPWTWESRAHALALRLGPGGALTLETAAHLHGVETQQPQVITGAMVGRQVQRLTGTRVGRRRSLDVVERGGLPVTPAATTVLDLTARPGVTWRETVHLVARWVHRGVVTTGQLELELTRLRRHPHRRVISTALDPVAHGVESVLELRSLRRVVIAHGLPTPTLQTRAVQGGARVRRDAEWEAYGVILESDGLLAHGGESIHRDRLRDRHAARSGRITLRAGYADIEFGPCELAADIYATLRTRGYRGRIVPCRPACVAPRVDIA